MTYLIRTNSLDSDERFVKTLRFLEQCHQEVLVFGVVKALSSNGCDFIERRLRLRRSLPSGRLVLLKYVELLGLSAWFLVRHRGRRWFANFDFLPLQVLSTLFSRRRTRPIWDLHEMPPAFVMENLFLRLIFAFLLKRSHVVVCNKARRDALELAFGVSLQDALILRNYPGKVARQQLVEARKNHIAVTTPREDLLTIVIVGGDMPGRYVEESIQAIAELRSELGLDIRVSLVGGAPLASAPEFVSSTGFIPFRELVARCVKGGISLCFYRMDTLNNVLCEPNRFYQGLLAGQFVITFAHPSLEQFKPPQRRIIDEANFHRSLKDVLDALFVERNGVSSTPTSGFEAVSDSFVFEKQLPDFRQWLLRACQ
ncbi:glycosyltransferase family protein [Qipengyuania flava]|uniref:hypothetical protein n=1 Tax=Qipengyuania flava TaxID=192812 RepID=UPI00125D1F44|nr:hypothetical protein [Qipengyuania flava]